MFNLFKPTKTYCICWAWIEGTVNQDIIRAKDTAHAWKKLKDKHPRATYCFSITERKNEAHDDE